MTIISYKRFKSIDLLVFSILAALSEFLSYFLLTKFTSTIFVSLGTLVFIISSIRWGRASIFVLIASSIPLLFVTGIPLMEATLYYGIANLFAAIPIMIYGKRDRNILRDKPWSLILYLISVFLVLSIGKGAALFLIDGTANAFMGYVGSILLTLIISVLFLLLLNRRREELVVDMDKYLERMSKGEVYE